MGTYVALHFVAKFIKWLLILSAYYCPSICVYKLHLATLGMDYLSIAIILLCGYPFNHIRYGLPVSSYHSLMWLAI